jgi:hypothetical protein
MKLIYDNRKTFKNVRRHSLYFTLKIGQTYGFSLPFPSRETKVSPTTPSF